MSAGRRPLRLLAPQPHPLLLAVVLGLVLSRRSSGAASTASAPRRSSSSLLNGGSDDGFIGHTIFWDRPVDLRRRWTYNIDSRHGAETSTIQPPLLAWAWRIAVGDPADEPRIAAHHRWLEANRDLDGDGLLWIVQPDESGLDSSPEVRPGLGPPGARHGSASSLLIQRNRRRDWDARRILDDGGPVLCEVVTNVLWGLARLATGEPSITPALVDRLWDERPGTLPRRRPGRVVHPGACWTRAMATTGFAPTPGQRWRPSRCRTCPRRSGAAWSRSTCSTRDATGRPIPRPRSRRGAAASSRATGRPCSSAATGAARPGSTPPG